MKKVLKHFFGKALIMANVLFAFANAGKAQTTITMSTANCSISANEVQMDIKITNTSPVSTLRFNSTVLRMTVPATMIPAGAQTYTFNYLGGSDFPLGFPAAGNPAAGASFNAVSRLLTWTTGSAGVYNNTGCPTSTAVPILPGETKTIGRFSFKITSANFVSGADATFTWSTTTSCNLYIDCAGAVTGFNQASGFRTLAAPCVLTVPVACSSPTVNTNPSDQSVCSSGSATFTGSFTGGTPAPTLLWQVQTGGVGLFTDLTETAPYSGTATGTLTITNPNISLSTNRYRLKASNGCPDAFTTDALLTVNPNVSAGTVSGVASLCGGLTATFTSDGQAGGTWSSTNPLVASVNGTGVVTALTAGTTDITYTVNAGCGSPVSAFKTLTVTGNAGLAGTPGGPIACSIATVSPTGTSYADGTCKTIANVLPSGLVPVTGDINTCVTVDDQVYTYHSKPYVQRHYDIVPVTNAANATATITLFFTQAEFDAYNLARGPYPALPVDGNDALGKGNLLITQFHGTGTYPGNYTGPANPDLVNPDDNNVVWNATLNRWEVTFNVNGFSGFYIFTSLSSTPLPVGLLSFSGNNNGNANLLEWTTSAEENSSYFELQRSLDGVNFVKAATVSASGNSNVNRNYAYSDDVSAIDARLFYYRLKLVDNSGVAKYSSIVKIRLNGKGFHVEASPNPFVDQMRVQVDANQKENAQLILSSQDGRRVKVLNSTLNKGSNVIVIEELNNLPGGVYLLTVRTDSEKKTLKVIKQQ